MNAPAPIAARGELTLFKPQADAFAVEINAEHELAQQAAETAVEHAIRCGQLLIAKKAQMKHGGFMPWIEQNCNFQQSTASRYMKAAHQISTGVEISSLGSLFGPTHNHRAQGTGENEWYTPEEHIEAARSLLGAIDLDPASSIKAQLVVRATAFYTLDDDGLAHEWRGRVWLNPPYAQPAIQKFAEKMVQEARAGNVPEAVMLTHNYTDTEWFHIAESACSAICFTRGRIAFIDPDGRKAAPTQGQAFFYYGARREEFAKAFGQFGFVR